MASIKIGSDYAFSVDNLDFSILFQGREYTATDSLFEVDYGGDQRDVFRGRGFSYNSDGVPISGTVDRYESVRQGDTIVTVSDIDLAATAIVRAARTGGRSDDRAVIESVLGGGDSFDGGDKGDRFDAGNGNDMLDGNGGADDLFGSGGRDTLRGGSGADDLFGGSGDDRLFGDDGEDSLSGNDGNDRLEGGAGKDTLVGGVGQDRLDGGSGSDIMEGGTQDDTYVVDRGSDQIIEAIGGGKDTVLASGSYRLAADVRVERLYAISEDSTDDLNLTGNELSQTIRGNNGDNVLNGGSGKDALRGFGGADTFVFADNPAAGMGVDTIADFDGSEDHIELRAKAFRDLIVTKDGHLASGALKLLGEGVKLDPSDRILYNKASGALYFDRDGSETTFKAIKFADLSDGADLSASDFLVV